MDQCLLIKLVDGSDRLINERQICSLENKVDFVLLRLSNGEELPILSPPWDDWLNDYLNRKS